jgi:hypothetical protein
MTCDRHSAESDRACSALHHESAPANAATNVNRPVSSDAGNAKACALIHRHFFGQWSDLVDRNYRQLR